MSPYSFSDILDHDIHNWASRQALDDRERTGRDIPTGIYVEKLAQRLGLTRRQIYRYMSGESVPPPDTLVALLNQIESRRPIEWYCREVDLGYYRRVRADETTPRDLVALIAHQLTEASKAAQDALKALGDGVVTIPEYRELERELDHAMDCLTDTKSALRGKVADGLRA